MSLVQFHTGRSQFKKVKTVNACLISDLKGVLKGHDIPVYMSHAGSPSFVISVPPEYENAWVNHRGVDSLTHRNRISIIDHWIFNASFEGALKDIETLSLNYKRHIESLTVRKVILIRSALVAPTASLYHNRPSFDTSRVLVGLRSEIFWEVNGRMYVDDRRGMIFDDTSDENPAVDPTYDQLRPSGRSTSGEGTVIPFTVSAWKTICDIEATLERAAVMLHQLTVEDTAQALLEGGAPRLLGTGTG